MINNKKRLFEVMEYINPKIINENNDDLSGDVLNIKNIKTDALKSAYSRINNQKEFNDAFIVWFNSLGFDDKDSLNKINITTSISHIRDFMEKKGVNY